MKSRTTKLTPTELSKVTTMVKAYLETHSSINNRSLRSISGVNYDQAINIFRHMIDEGNLIKEGKSSGTKYHLPNA